jgi:hypothetical protein
MAKQTFTTGQVLTAAQMTSLQQTAMGGGSTTAKTASYVLVAADAGTVVQMNSASATTITVNTALFAAGDTVQIQNVGSGVCTVTAGTATVSTSAVLALKQYDAGSLYFNSTSAALFFAADAADNTSPLTTKGDIYTFSTTNDRLPVGTNNQTLVADSTASTGLKWATPASGGKVLQVVTATYATSTSNSTATYADTGLTATITPTLNTSKVLVLVYHNGITKSAAVNYQQMSIKLVRASTDILISSGINYVAVANDASTTFAASILDSPATTSATTYKTTFNSAGVASVTIQAGGSTSTITLLEIGA